MSATSIDVEALQQGLDQFTGTEGYYRLHRDIFPNIVLTDGAKYLGEKAGATWLLTAIATHMPMVRPGEWFVVCKLVVASNRSATLTIQSDDPGHIYARQQIPFTDFPLAEIKLYAARAGDGWVIMLPSEY